VPRHHAVRVVPRLAHQSLLARRHPWRLRSGEDPSRIAVLPGDGIGPEVTVPTLDLLHAATSREGLAHATENHPAGAACWRWSGAATGMASRARC
jgi:hypothetical protein